MIAIIYLDNAATTKISKEILDEMMPYLTEQYGNPSSQHSLGLSARKAVAKAREQVAAGIGAKPDEIVFTSGGSEADNLAIKGVCEMQARFGRYKIITTNVEHPAVLNTCRHLEKHGYKVTYLSVNSDGFITPEQVEAVIDSKTALVTVMLANNEIGSIQPVQEIGAICHAHGVPFHVDAVQAVGSLHIDVCKQNIDLMSISGHKIHGPKGIGCLYIRNGIDCAPLIDGGGQENGMRSGTENVASIVGLGKAVEITTHNIDERQKYVAWLQDCLISSIVDGNKVKLNGARNDRLCGNVNVSFKGKEGESIALMLSTKGICASAKSACSAGSLEPSYVIKAIGCPDGYLYGAVRFSLNDKNTAEDIAVLTEALEELELI